MMVRKSVKLAKWFLRHPLARHVARRELNKVFTPDKKEASPMKNKVRGGAFRLTGLILGIVGTVVSVNAIVFSAIGLRQARLCKKCEKGAEFH